MTLLSILIACQGNPAQPNQEEKAAIAFTAKRIELQEADKVACVDLNKDGNDEHIFIRKGSIHTPTTIHELNAGTQTFWRDGQRLLIGSGFSKDFRNATMSVHELTADGIKELWTFDGPRNQITDLSVVNDQIYMSTFTQGTTIAGGWMNTLDEPVFTSNMAMRQRPLPENPSVVVAGRLYGDAPRSDGDLQVIRNGQSTIIPSHRGVRALEVHDMNGDGHSDLLVSDGWHYQYASMGRAQLHLYLGPHFTDRRTLAVLDGQYTINKIHVHPDKHTIVLQGSSQAFALTQSKFGWQQHTLGAISESGNTALCLSKEGSYVLLSGNPSTKVFLPSR